jgi:hypothetical protein
MREAMLDLPDSPMTRNSLPDNRAPTSRQNIYCKSPITAEPNIPREAVQAMTGLKRSTIILYHKRYGIGQIVYNHATKRLGLMFSLSDIDNMLTIFKRNTAPESRREAQMRRSTMLFWEFTQRLIRRLDQLEEWRLEMDKKIWALQHPPETRELEDRKNEGST